MWSFNPVLRGQDIVAVRAFVQSVAKATRWRDSVPDPAEHACSLIVSHEGQEEIPDVFLLFDGSARFPVSVAAGEVTVNGKHVAHDTDRYREIVGAAQELALSLLSPTNQRQPDQRLALVHQFAETWKCLDPSLEPKSTFEIYRMFASSVEASELLRQIRSQYAPYITGLTNRFQQLDNYFESRPERFVLERSPIAGNKVWTLKPGSKLT